MDLVLVALGSYHSALILQAVALQLWEWRFATITRLLMTTVLAALLAAVLVAGVDRWAVTTLAASGLAEAIHKLVRLATLAGESYRFTPSQGRRRGP